MSFLSLTLHCGLILYLNHMLLDTGRVTTPQYAEQFIIRNEEEARKSITLGIQVVIETLLASLQTVTQGLQVC